MSSEAPMRTWLDETRRPDEPRGVKLSLSDESTGEALAVVWTPEQARYAALWLLRLAQWAEIGIGVTDMAGMAGQKATPYEWE